jgi:hypothetical protein
MVNYFGKETIAKDGKKYRSQFEANFVNKFLLPSGLEFVYEVPYPNSKMTCDFYIPEFDIWIECVYHYAKMKYSYETEFKRINLPLARYENKEFIKAYGGLWDTKIKQWYITYKGKELKELHRFMEPEELKVIIESDGKAIHKDYDDKLFEKITNKKCNILIVNNDDLGYNDLTHLICAKENIFVLKNIVTKILGQRNLSNIGKNITEIYRLAEQSEEIVKQLEEIKKNNVPKEKINMSKIHNEIRDILKKKYNGDYSITEDKTKFIINELSITREVVIERLHKLIKEKNKVKKRKKRKLDVKNNHVIINYDN